MISNHHAQRISLLVLRHMMRIALKKIAREAFENEGRKPSLRLPDQTQGDLTRNEDNVQGASGRNRRHGGDGSMKSIHEEGSVYFPRKGFKPRAHEAFFSNSRRQKGD